MERDPTTKAFSVPDINEKFKYNFDTYNYRSHPDFMEALSMLKNCHEQARKYSIQTFQKLQDENPDFLEEKGLSAGEFINHSAYNLCLPLQKKFAEQYRKTEARVRDHLDVKD